MDNRHGKSLEKSIGVEILSVVFLATGVFALCALATFHSDDPSLFNNLAGAVRNACGIAGAQLSAALLHLIGLGGFLAPAAFFFMAATLHQKRNWVRVLATLAGMTVSTLALTVFLSLQWKTSPLFGADLLTGGAFGTWLAQGLLRSFNPVGSSIVSLSIFLLAIVLSTPISVAHFLGNSIRFASLTFWRFTRWALTYAVYLMGVMILKIAQFAGVAIQRGMEEAIRRTREKAKELARAKPAMKPVVGPAEPVKAKADTVEAEWSEIEGAEGGSGAQSGDLGEEEFGEDDEMPMPSKAKPIVISEMMAEKQEQLKLKLKIPTKRGAWKLPTIEFLRKVPKIESTVDREKIMESSRILQQKLADFGIDGEVTAVRPGPVITLYEFKPGPGVKVSRISALADDLSMALSAKSVRILAPLPGTSVVGIEIPSDVRQKVFLREFLQHPDFFSDKFTIPVVMGKDISGQPVLSDLARMPHLLCAGQTGAGKSVFMNSLIISLLYRFSPDELRMILVDPKFIEFRSYQDTPHLLLPVVDDPKHASIALKWAVREMERRYRILAIMGVRNLTSYNVKVDEMGADVVHDLLFAEENQTERAGSALGSDWIEAFELDDNGTPRVGKLPYIVIIIDELADLMMVAKKDVEISIARIAQKARASGIHLVLATQRPSTDVITGLIKANLPARLSFQLASFVDSKTILDRSGAERLLGQGDMLFIPPGVSQLVRLHGAYVDDDEIHKITSFLKAQGKPGYRDEILVDEEEDESLDGETESTDELFDEAVELVKRSGHASASFLQRHLKVGYNRAARMIEMMESRGIVGPPDGARPREVLMR